VRRTEDNLLSLLINDADTNRSGASLKTPLCIKAGSNEAESKKDMTARLPTETLLIERDTLKGRRTLTI